MFVYGGAVLASDSASVERVPPEVRATLINSEPPTIDGDLSDSIWSHPQMDFAGDFRQYRPDEGEPATESTLVAVAYDEAAIYFAFWCYDSEPEKIAGQLVRRDRHSESDLIAVRLDPYHDHQTGYDFYVNAAGVQLDARLYNENHNDYAWDGVWESAVRMQPWGWSVEIRIPFYCLRFAEKENHVWGCDFARAISRKDESFRWSFTPIAEGGFVSNFGHLTGLRGISPGSHIELLPYAVSSFETEPKRPGNPNGKDFLGNVGFDLKYALTSNLVVDVTINPDFGQVELDRPVLNLSTFETRFEERRPFFLEGAELFQAEYSMFYSRRIGRRPNAYIQYPGYYHYDPDYMYSIDYPKATTILGAAKITGKLGSGTSIAILGAVTDEEKASYAARTNIETDSLGNIVACDTVHREGIVEPMAGYSVVRVKQDLFEHSNIGGILTVASRDTEHPAVTGAADWRLFTNGGVWCFRGQSVFSRVDSEDIGFATDATIEKVAGEHFHMAIGAVIKDRYLQINDLGYTTRNNWRSGWLWMHYETRDDWWIIRRSWNNFNMSGAWNYDGDNINKNWNFSNTTEFLDNSMGGFGFARNFAKYSDDETRGYGLWERPSEWNVWVWYDTDERRKFSVEGDFNYGDSRGHPWWGAQLLFRYRPASNMEFWVHGDYTHDPAQLAWIDNPDDDAGNIYVLFADRDQDIFHLTASASIMFNRDLSFQLSARGLMAGIDHHRHREYLGGTSYGDVWTHRSSPAPFPEADYNWSALNSTALLRWEYNPGSTLYLVWTRSRPEYDPSCNDLKFNRDFSRWFSAGAENVFLIKASYWLNV